MENISEETSAGGVLLRFNNGIAEALLIKVRYYGYELPKGHIEAGETAAQAAGRELCEETTLLFPPKVGKTLGDLEYTFKYDNKKIHKKVDYFAFTTENEPVFGEKPKDVKELRWIKREELDNLPLVNEELRPIIRKAFESDNP